VGVGYVVLVKETYLNMKINILGIIFLNFLLISCKANNQTIPNDKVTSENKGLELVQAMVQKVGDYKTLADKKNVEYTYTYKTPDGKIDVSTEKYIFDGELSYGIYKQHEKTFPELKGVIEQGFDGSEYWQKHNGKILSDESILKKVAFRRPTNYYWFTMMQKLLDSGLNYEFLGEKSIDNQDYNIVKVTFDSEDDKPTDIYQLYINKKTSLVDQFLFTVADFGKMDIPNLMQLKYEEVDGILLPAKRQYKKSTWDANVTDEPWIYATWSDIKFNTKITKEDFKKENNMQNTSSTSLKSKLEERKANFELKADDNKKRAYVDILWQPLRNY